MYQSKQEKDAYKKTKARMKALKKEFKNNLKAQDGEYGGMGTVTESEGIRYIEGIINMGGGKFEKLFVEGILNVKGDITSEILDVEGVCNFNGNLDVQNMHCEGTATITGDTKICETNVEGIVNINGKLEAEQISCLGVIHVNGELSADKIDANGMIYAKQIVGDNIKIFNKYAKSWLADTFMGMFKLNKPIELIEATTINIEKVNAKEVNGQDVTIGPKCKIEHVDCSGTLKIDPSAKVDKITGDYQKV